MRRDLGQRSWPEIPRSSCTEASTEILSRRSCTQSSNLDKPDLEELPWYLSIMFPVGSLAGIIASYLETNVTKHARSTSRALPTTSGPPCKPRPKGVMKSHITTPRTARPVALSMWLAKRYPLFPPYDNVNTTNLSTPQGKQQRQQWQRRLRCGPSLKVVTSHYFQLLQAG